MESKDERRRRWSRFRRRRPREPQPVIERLNKDIVAGLATPETRKRLADLGLDAVDSTPAQTVKLVDEEIQRWSAVIKAANIKAE